MVHAGGCGVCLARIQGGKREEFAMPGSIRTDFDAAQLRLEARRSKDGAQTRRLLALATIYDGVLRTEAARIAGVTVQIIRGWVVKFNAHGPLGLWTCNGFAQVSLNELYALKLLRDNLDKKRIASLTDVPERLGHCLT
jgi:hypothetical protein